MNVTIIADASHCPETKVAGYGFWIASGRGKFGGGGAMRSKVDNSTIAEMQAVVNSLWIALDKGFAQEGDEILIQTDCLAAIQAFGSQRYLSADEQKVTRALRGLADNFKLKLKLKHVKGHTTRAEARFVTNNCCDKRAKAAMRKARTQHNINQCKEILNGPVSRPAA